MPQKTFYLKTFGCQMNYADSEKINMILLSSGLRKVLDPIQADIIIMNTCSVRQKGEDKVFGFIHEIQRFYTHHPELPRKPLFGITGCMVRKSGISKAGIVKIRSRSPQSHGETIPLQRKHTTKITLLSGENALLNYDDGLFLRSQEIDFVFRIEEVSFLTKILSLLFGEHIGNDEKFNAYLNLKQLQENPASGNVIIQTGCDNFCTFCIVPHARGRETSRNMEDIIAEVDEIAKKGTKEITLLGQNVNSYGKETRAKLWNPDTLTWKSYAVKTPFRELLERLNTIEGIERIRFTSSNPHDMTRDILDAHFDLGKLCNYLHFALQSGSNTLLKKMNRKHTYTDFKKQITYLRSRDPLFSLSTDIIVGFPGETEQEFYQTVQAMEECEFDFAYIARYSPRSGTIAAEQYGDSISSEEKAHRWSILNALLKTSIQKRAVPMIGRTEEILIAGKGRSGGWVGRTRNFKEVYIDENPCGTIGAMIPVEIQSLDGWILRGKILS